MVAPPAFSRGSLPHTELQEKQRTRTPQYIPEPSADRLARRHLRRLKRVEGRGETRERTLRAPTTGRDPSRPSRRTSSLSREAVGFQKPVKIANPLAEEFDLSASKSHKPGPLPASFSSPPLLDGLRDSVLQVLGSSAFPTPIQALSLKHLFTDTPEWRQYLLASETGSGKSIAYLLPMLHHLKKSELASSEPTSRPQRAVNPRALVLAPTHELSRQLASFAKALLHHTKLRVLSASRANTKSTHPGTSTASKMAAQFADDTPGMLGMPYLGVSRPVDLLVGTPNKLLEMTRGRGWNRNRDETDEQLFELHNEPSFKSPEPEMGLQNVEWVVIDEADILFGIYPDLRSFDGWD